MFHNYTIIVNHKKRTVTVKNLRTSTEWTTASSESFPPLTAHIYDLPRPTRQDRTWQPLAANWGDSDDLPGHDYDITTTKR